VSEERGAGEVTVTTQMLDEAYPAEINLDRNSWQR
jgi:hypothetical protein